MMTEAEARKRWCPKMPRAVSIEEDQPEHVCCIGARCMAWRWLPSGDIGAKIEAIKAHRNEHGSSLLEAKNAIEKDWRPVATEGFCGLAGRPGV